MSRITRPPPAPGISARQSGARALRPAPATQAGFYGVLVLNQVDLASGPEGINLTVLAPFHAEDGWLGFDDERAMGWRPTGTHTLDLGALPDRFRGQARPLRSGDDLTHWLDDLGGALAVELLVAHMPAAQPLRERALDLWEALNQRQQRRWVRWLREHTGLQRLELAIHAYFANGGTTAWVAIGVDCPDAEGVLGLEPIDALHDAFDGCSDMSMVSAPGLNADWQQAVATYAAAGGRGNLLGIVDAWPLHVADPAGHTKGHYAIAPLITAPQPVPQHVRREEDLVAFPVRDAAGSTAAFAPWLLVDNPLGQHADERFVLAPPSGFVAGALAGAISAPGGGVHTPLSNLQLLGVAEPAYAYTDEQRSRLEGEGVNSIVQAGRHGIRVHTGVSVSTDPRWRQIERRRVWLHVARSLRDGLQWAVTAGPEGLPAVEATISEFLDKLTREGLLDDDGGIRPWEIVRTNAGSIEVWVRPLGMPERVQVVIHSSS